IFREMFDVLSHCDADCDKSCYKCLRYYGNQYKHTKLDRYLGLDLLTFLLNGEIREYDDQYQLELLNIIQRTNELLDLESVLNKKSLQVEHSNEINVRIRNNIKRKIEKDTLYFSPYDIINDLPNVHEKIRQYSTVVTLL